MGAKRAEITILFADIRGFTALSEKLEPEAVVGILNECLSVFRVAKLPGRPSFLKRKQARIWQETTAT